MVVNTMTYVVRTTLFVVITLFSCCFYSFMQKHVLSKHSFLKYITTLNKFIYYTIRASQAYS